MLIRQPNAATLEVHVGVSDSLEGLMAFIAGQPVLRSEPENDCRTISEEVARKIIHHITDLMMQRSPLAGPDVQVIRRIPLSTIDTVEIYKRPSDLDNDSVYALGLVVDHAAS